VISPTETAADPLSLTEERGGAVLVCGAAAAARRARIDEIVASVARGEGPRPVVIRIAARTQDGALGDAIAAAVEAELTRLRAPGGLYDDPSGGPLASLGGWLFRARSIRKHGVLIVLDDVDEWIDARGAVSAEAEALSVLRRVLKECTRRPVALLASVRASDASGEPALPGDVVSAFTSTERLGGAPTVTRDPMSLVVQLAGRSFTLGALKHALAGWLEVPAQSDDTVVVFSSPLNPPALEIEPVEAEVAFARGASDATTTTAASEKTSTAPLADGWSDAVRAAVDVREALRALRGLGERHGARQWERMFSEGASKLPSGIAALERGERALGLEATRIGRRGHEALEKFEASFREYYANAYDAWLGGTSRPTMLCDLPAKITRAATERQARGTAFVIVTGLRVDAWQRLRQRVVPRVAGLTVIEEGLHWAARPATSQVQRELLARGLTALGTTLPPRDEPTAPRTFDEAIKPRREHLGHHEVLRIDAYAMLAAQSTETNFAADWDRIERALAPVLLTLCGNFAGRTVFAIAGDAGMRETGARGGMGGDSPFEVLVPYALLTWG
jgi:hypothetical protein